MKSKILFAFAAFAVSASAHATELVKNGGFTQLSNGPGQFDTNTAVAGWSGNGGYNFVFNKADDPAQGVYGGLALWDEANGGNSSWDGKTLSGIGNFAAMDGAFIVEPITQTITNLKAGQSYTLSFNYAFGQQYGYNGATIQGLATHIGSTLFDTGDVNVADHGFTGWTTENLKFTANSSSEVLSFLARGNLPVPPFALVSDVSVKAVPEAQVWAMMILGLGAVGMTMRSRRRAMPAMPAFA